jgi:hypothetical protein
MSMLPVAFMSVAFISVVVAFMSVAFRSVAFMSAVLFALLLLPHAASAANAPAIAILVTVFIGFPLHVAEPTATANGETFGSYC